MKKPPVNRLNYFLILLLLGLVLIGPNQLAHAAISFDSEKNLSTNAGNSQTPQITALGSNVYAVWRDFTTGTNEIFFANSTDNGVTFDPAGPFNLSNTGSSSTVPQIAVNGSSVYVIWDDGNDILFRASTDNGNTFGTTITLSGTPLTGAGFPQLAASGSNVYAVWTDDNEIFFANSTNNGASFDPSGPFQLSAASGSFLPQISAYNNNVYVSWHNTAGTDDIFFRASTNGGSSFGNELNLSNNAGNSNTAQIASFGNNVYVVWQDQTPGNFEIFFANSTDSGATFDPAGPFNLSSNAGSSTKSQITASGNNVYVTWQDDTMGNFEIFLKASINGGSSFGSLVNISDNSQSSTNPKISSVENNVTVAWQDLTPGNVDILLKVSENFGAIFGGVTNLSSNGGTSSTPDLAVSDSNVFVAWKDDTPGNNDILFKAGIPSPIDIQFNSTQYKLTETAKVNVTDSKSNTDPLLIENIIVNLNSTTDSTGLPITFTETGVNTGNFTGQLTFSINPSVGTILQASPGDAIDANFGGQMATSSIFSRLVSFDFLNYDLGTTAHVIVMDQNSNLDPITNETITVKITSGADPIGIDLSLNETGPNTGQFGNAFNNNLIFMPGNYLFSIPNSIDIVQFDDVDNSTTGIDTTTVTITSTSDPTGISLILTETGGKTAIFTGKLIFTAEPSIQGTSIQVSEGDFYTISHKAFFNSNGMIVPNPNPSNGAIQVINPTSDIVSANYLNVIGNATVATGDAPGGGGGGVVRPGLVLNAVVGIQTLFGGGGSSSAKPTISSSSLSLDTGISFSQLGENQNLVSQKEKIPLDGDSEKTKVVTTGKQMELEFDMYENKGSDRIKHVSFYLLSQGERINVKESTYIVYDKYDGVKINDPRGILTDGTIKLFEKDATNALVKISFTLEKAVGKLNLVVKAWDVERHANEWTFDNAINVLDQSEILETQINNEPLDSHDSEVIDTSDLFEQKTSETTSLIEEEKNIPAWVKTSARWWTQEQVSDEDFLLGVEYLIQENIIQVSEIPMTQTTSSQYVPDWFSSTVEWWSHGDLSDDEFIQGLEWLIENGVMKV